MRDSGSILDRYEVLFAAAVIAAHANAEQKIFRQRDVKFLIELFSNWIEHAIGGAVLGVQNTQISRYLEQLVEDGLCTKSNRGRIPSYQLRRIGVVDLLGIITSTPRGIQAETNFFALYFVKNYRPRLWELVEAEGKRFPFALRVEVEELLNYKSFIDRMIVQAETELKKLERRVSEAHEAASLASNLSKQGFSLEEIATQMERNHPYELNSQKPLSELIGSIPERFGLWELETGTTARAQDLWEPSEVVLRAYLESLQKLAKAGS